VDAYLRDLDAEPEAVRVAIDSLSESDLECYGLTPYRFNLLSLFGESWPESEVSAVAAAAMRSKLWRGWQFYSGWRRLGARLTAPGGGEDSALRGCTTLAGWDVVLPLLESEEPRPVLCTLHWGAYRDLPLDLALLGRSSTAPVNSEGYEQTQDALKHSHPLLAENYRVVNVDRPGGALALARAARRSDFLFAYVDGNTGTDGPWGDQGRVTIDFLGFRIRVKEGMARLAASLGAPLVPIVARRLGPERAQVVVGPPIRPAGRLKGQAQDDFSHSATQALYSFFEPHVRASPQDWESLCFLHRWRERDTGSTSPPLPDVERELADGASFRLDRRAVAVIRDARGPVLLDVRSLRSFRVPSWGVDALAALSDGGLGRDWLGRTGLDLPARERMVTLLSQLRQHGVVVPA
jgi:hypothetical protein